MSPEQATGDRDLDARSDVYSLGAMMYEMLTGDPPHVGNTVQAIIASVVTEEPRPITARRPTVPPNVNAAVHRALHKLPADRFATAAQFAYALGDKAFVDPHHETGLVGRKDTRWKRAALALGGAVAVLAVAVIALLVRGGSSSGLSGSVHLSIALPEGHEVLGPPAISRDGRTVAYVAGPRGSVGGLYIRYLRDGRASEVSESDGAKAPFFSWDGDQVGFFKGDGLWRVFVQGGAPVRVADATEYMGGVWGPDDRIIYSPTLGSGLMRIPASGGQPEQLTQPDFGEKGYAHTWPVILSDGRTLLHNVWGGGGGVARLDLETLEWEKGALPFFSAYSESGYLLGRSWSTGASTIRAGRYDPAGAIPPQLDHPVLQDSYFTQLDASEWLALSDNGTLVYAPGDPARRRLAVITTTGETTSFDVGLAQYEQVAVAPDAHSAAVLVASNQISILDLERRTLETILAPQSELDAMFHPVWSGDGNRLFYASNRTGDWEIYAMDTQAAGAGEIVLEQTGFEIPLSVGPDGVLLYLSDAGSDRDLWLLEPDGSATQYYDDEGDQVQGRFSPQGNAIAFVSDVSGAFDVFVKPYPSLLERRAVRVASGRAPIWSPDGNELFFVTGDSLMGVQVRPTNRGLTIGTPRLVVRRNFWSNIWGRPYDVLPNGDFLIIDPMPDSYPTRLDVVFDFFAVIEERVGN
jgi:serine/threonine-protein kinase